MRQRNVVDDLLLRHLQEQAVPGAAPALLANDLGDGQGQKRDDRNVHRQLQMPAHKLKLGGIADSLAYADLGQADEVFLGRIGEILGLQHAQLRMANTRQPLGADKSALLQVQLRLVPKLHPMLFERLAKVDLRYGRRRGGRDERFARWPVPLAVERLQRALDRLQPKRLFERRQHAQAAPFADPLDVVQELGGPAGHQHDAAGELARRQQAQRFDRVFVAERDVEEHDVWPDLGQAGQHRLDVEELLHLGGGGRAQRHRDEAAHGRFIVHHEALQSTLRTACIDGMGFVVHRQTPAFIRPPSYRACINMYFLSSSTFTLLDAVVFVWYFLHAARQIFPFFAMIFGASPKLIRDSFIDLLRR